MLAETGKSQIRNKNNRVLSRLKSAIFQIHTTKPCSTFGRFYTGKQE